MKLVMTAILTASLALTGSFVSAGAPGGNTIADLVASSGGEFDNNRNDFDILLNAVVAANLVAPLADEAANLTVFAPNDRAFMRLASDLGWSGEGEAEAWVFLVGALTELGGGDPIPVLTSVLLYHVVDGRLSLADITRRSNQTPIETLGGGSFQPRGVQLIDQEPDLTNPRILPSNTYFGSNGNIFTIDRVLIPIDLP